MTIHGIDAITNIAKPIKITDQKLHIKSSDIETKLDTINTSLGSLSVSVGDVDVNTDGLEGLVGASNTSLLAIADSTDGIEGLLTSLDSAQDLTNTKLTALVSASGINRTSSTFMNAEVMAADSQYSGSFDASAYKSVRILGSSLNGGSINIVGSVDGFTWFLVSSAYAQMNSFNYNYSEVINNSPKYLSIATQSQGDTITIVCEGQSF